MYCIHTLLSCIKVLLALCTWSATESIHVSVIHCFPEERAKVPNVIAALLWVLHSSLCLKLHFLVFFGGILWLYLQIEMTENEGRERLGTTCNKPPRPDLNQGCHGSWLVP